MTPSELDYHPFYCEENIWRLGQREEMSGVRRAAVFISSQRKMVPLFSQRAGRPEDGLVVWDYHVVLLTLDAPAQIYDLDCRAGAPTSVPQWLQACVPELSALASEYHPRFRVVPWPTFMDTFSSDRSHMMNPAGGYRAAPPDWPAPVRPGEGSNLLRFVDVETPFHGDVMDVEGLLELACRPSV